MATYTFTTSDFSLTTSWVRRTQSAGIVGDSIVSDTTTKAFNISGITLGAGESVNYAKITAKISYSGTIDYSSTITVNGLGFVSGERRIMDLSGIANGSAWNAQFYVRASGEAGRSGALNENVHHSCTINFTEVTLTVTTGAASAFDGLIESLPEGTKISVTEANGTALYTIVQHDYNTGKCLLWRDEILSGVQVNFNDNNDWFSKDQGSGSNDLDIYLEETFYNSLPQSTKQYIVTANYPTLTKRPAIGGSVADLERHVCTPSLRELKDQQGGAEGILLMYLNTINSGAAYWTRSIYTGSTGQAQYITASGSSTYKSRTETSGVRPAFTVLETQLVMPNSDGVTYSLTSPVAAPTNVYVNGGTTNLTNLQRDVNITLSWTAVNDSRVKGYEVWVSSKVGNGAQSEYTYYGKINSASTTSLQISSGEKGFTEKHFKVKAITSTDTDYLNSPLSTVSRSFRTKDTNAHYFNGSKWLLVTPKYYNGSTWVATEGASYYNGSSWQISDE